MTPRQTAAAFFVATFLAAGSFPARALEPPTKEQLARYRLDGSLAARVARAKALGNQKIPRPMVERLRNKLARLSPARPSLPGPSRIPPSGRIAAQARSLRLPPDAIAGAPSLRAEGSRSVLSPPPAWAGMPTLGTVRILTLLISFSDAAGVTAPADFESRLFGAGAGGPPFDSLASYYQRASYGQLAITGDVLGWYQAPYARSTVLETDSGRQNLIKEALSYYDAQGWDFSPYDNDGDGSIDYLSVFWSGPHDGWSDFWWGYYAWFTDSTFRLDGKRLTNYSWQWELYDYPGGSFTPDTIIHETGHALGVPDYYDYDDSVGPRGGVGGLDIMDGTGDHNCFSKFLLDWIAPTVVSSGAETLALRASGLWPDAVLFMPGAAEGRIFDEYFMVQNRARTGNDTGLFTGSDGLVVWHVDARLNAWDYDYLYDNSFTEHKLLRLMEADGLEEIERWAAYADAGDYYRAGMAFGPGTLPNSDRYGGVTTAMTLSGITGTTTPMSVTITSTDSAPAVDIASPAAGQAVYGAFPVEVAVTDDAGVDRVELYVDAALAGTLSAGPFIFSLDSTALTNGRHMLRAVAYDSIGLSASAEVEVLVDNIGVPAGFKAVKAANRSLLFGEYVNVLTWANPPVFGNILQYRIYRLTDGGRALVASVPMAGVASYRYLDRGVGRAEIIIYEVVGVNPAGREGPAAAATAR